MVGCVWLKVESFAGWLLVDGWLVERLKDLLASCRSGFV